MNSYPGWKLWQTEYCVMDGPEGRGGRGRDLTMKTALGVARLMLLDLTLAGVSAWQWWLAVSEADYKDGLIYTDWKRPGDAETIYPSRLFWTLGNFSRHIRPGMLRVELSGDGHDIGGLMGAAFRNPDGRRIVAVYANMGEQDRRVSLHLMSRGLIFVPSSVLTYVTSDRPGDELKFNEPADRSVFNVPARSVVTMVAEL
jgi:hypothetical protein